MLRPSSPVGTAAADIGPQPTAPAVPALRSVPSDGYRRALAAHQEAAPPRRVDPAIAEAAARQTKAMRALSLRAFPDSEGLPADEPASIDTARVWRRPEADSSHAAALRRARAERAERQPETAAAVKESAALRSTA